MNADVAASVEMLYSTQSAARRRGAKRLRKLKDCTACAPLQAALGRELADPRTWETQYQLIMALGESGCRGSLPLLEELGTRVFDATMLYVAIGDALVRLTTVGANDASRVLSLMRTARHPMLIEGAFRAMAMMKMIPAPGDITHILEYVRALAPANPLRFWVAAGAPGWTADGLDAFLQTCESSPREDLREAAASARARRYKTWKPL